MDLVRHTEPLTYHLYYDYNEFLSDLLKTFTCVSVPEVDGKGNAKNGGNMNRRGNMQNGGLP